MRQEWANKADNIIKKFKNFSSDPIGNEELLKKPRGTVVINEFKALPEALLGSTSDYEPVVKWYQYRLRTKIYFEGDDIIGVDGISTYAIKIFISGSNAVLYKVYYESMTAPGKNWILADNCDVQVDKDDELRIITKDSSAAKSKDYKPLHMAIMEKLFAKDPKKEEKSVNQIEKISPKQSKQ